ncbi:ATP-binding protein [uncultured Lacinutrix sp.]|uniref:ATP-binding protein n=1 Tax=uncultured Lacinutrix sp. TaxID=574032 RepID=UPI00262C75E7|nr:ATP-binding protein [uncultured Lacinutrix sp.]
MFLFLGALANAQEPTQEELETLQTQVNAELSFAQKSIEDSQYPQANASLENALINAEKLANKKSLGIIYSKLGKIQHLQEKHDQAITTLIKAVEVQRFAKDNFNIAETYKTLGDVYFSTNRYEKALDYYKSAETLFKQEDLHKYETEAVLKKGQTFLALNEFKNAESTFNEAISLSRRFQFEKLLSRSLLQLGEAQAKNGSLGLALKSANEGFNIAKENKILDVLSAGYLTLSNLKEADGNYRLANKYLRAHLKISDSLMTIKRALISSEKTSELLVSNQINYQKQAQADLEEVASSNTFTQLITILSIALITILSLLTLSLYKNNNIRLKSNNVLHKKNSELIVSKEKAELASKTKANFLSTVTHELRTPLYAVTGLTNMLLDENPKPEQIPHLKSLKFSGDYLLTFINDILQINKIEANKVEVESEVFNLKKKIANVISALNNSAVGNNVKLHFEYDDNLPHNYNADQLKISQILINLIGNSIKFTKNGDIWVRASKISEENGVYNVRFEVQDNGIGISTEKQEHMFESFSQGSIQINRKYGGTGLGLSIVKGLIDILKGKIYLKSMLGQGSTFFFELPLQFAEEAIEKEQISYFKDISEVELSDIKILIVEDNKINQMITKKILNKMKLKCEVVENGEDAVEKIKTNTYDVVLMDIHMPGISGIEATKIIRTFNKDLTIFALTAVTIEDKMVEFDEAGFTDIISKPFKQEDFEKKLFDALILKENA